MPQKYFAFLCFLCVPLILVSQDFKVSGAVYDANKSAVSFANVLLLKATDSTVVKGTSSLENGEFEILNISKENYTLKVSFVGFKDAFIDVNVNGDLDIGKVFLEDDFLSLEEVSIFSRRPSVTKEADRIIFEIENTSLSEGSIMQVLKSTPGILIINDKITIKNSTPTVYINNRKVYLSPSELVQLLEGTSASAVKSVEVITNPSAKYDASSGTVLNIVMSKNLVTGYNGNVYGNFSQGVFPRYNAGINNYFKTDKLNFYVGYSYSQNKIDKSNEERINYFDSANEIDEIWETDINRNTWTQNHNIDLNLDFFLNDNNTLRLASNLLWTPYFKYNINNYTKVYDANRALLYNFDANNLSRDDKHNIGADLEFVHKFKKQGEVLSVNAHYTTFDYLRNQDVSSTYFFPDNTSLDTAFESEANQNTKIIIAQADYVLPLNNNGELDFGVKFSEIDTRSYALQYDVVNNSPILNVNNSNEFNYDEDIFSVYGNFEKQWSKWNITTGLRLENTNLYGSVTNGGERRWDYLNVFPTLLVNHDASDNFSIYANYKRSIIRPDFQNLNPFRFYINDNTVVTGNPDLEPIIIDHTTIGTTIKGMYTIEAYYKTYKDNIFELPRQDNDQNIVAYSPFNLEQTTEFGIDFITYFSVTKNWSVYFVTSLYNAKDEGAFDGESISIDQWSNYSVISNDFSFLKDHSLTANFTCTYISKNVQGLQLVDDRLISEISIAKSIFKNKAVMSLSISDAFNMQDFSTKSLYLNQDITNRIDIDSRYIKFGFRYKFGNTNLKTNKRSKSQQERDRLKDL